MASLWICCLVDTGSCAALLCAVMTAVPVAIRGGAPDVRAVKGVTELPHPVHHPHHQTHHLHCPLPSVITLAYSWHSRSTTCFSSLTQCTIHTTVPAPISNHCECTMQAIVPKGQVGFPGCEHDTHLGEYEGRARCRLIIRPSKLLLVMSRPHFYYHLERQHHLIREERCIEEERLARLREQAEKEER